MASKAEYSNMWIDMWKDGIAPGQASSTVVTALRTKTLVRFCACYQYNVMACLQRFDKTRAAPSLVRALEEGILSVKKKRALVPGCGYVSSFQPVSLQ